jgi:hypothetical protein
MSTIEAAAPVYLTEAEASDRLRLAKKTLANWRALGEGPGYIKLGRAVRYPTAILDAWAMGKVA